MLPLAADPQFSPLLPPDRPAMPVEGAGVDALRGAAAILLAGSDAWDRLRALRSSGLHCGAVLMTRAESPEDRGRLEPVVLLREPSTAALLRALDALEAGALGEQYALAGGVADTARQVFRRDDGAVIALSGLESRLLAYLAARRGRAVHRDELQTQVWDHKRPVATRAVDMAVVRLRQKIELDPAAPRTLLTVRGDGYRAVEGPGERAAAAPPTSGPGRFVGRTELLAAVEAAFAPGCAVALVGPPGVGKSRLAREVAARAGLGVLDLEAPRTGEDPGTTLATRLDVPVGDGDPIVAVARRLRGARLVLDHVDGWEALASRLVPALAEAGAALLMTMQAAPRVPGVSVIHVPPLSEDDGAALLLDRATGAADRAQARALVALLDGLPLAIELAATWLPALGPDGLREAMATPGGLLSPSEGDRHGSLGAAIGEAWGRLAPYLQTALSALTVYRAPFTLAAGAAVVGPEGAAAVAALASRSLLTREGPRFRLLNAVRDHVVAISPDRTAAVAAHGRWIGERARDLGRRVGRFGGRDAFAELARLDADLLAAIDTAPTACVPDIVAALEHVWVVTGTESDRAGLRERGLRAVAGDPAARAAIRASGVAARVNVDPAWVVREARALWPEIADPEVVARLAVPMAHALYVTEGPVATLAFLGSLRLDGVGPVGALRVRAAAARYGIADASERTRELQAVFEELVAEGEALAAVGVGVALCREIFDEDPGRCLRLAERLVAWEEDARDPRLGASSRSMLAAALTVSGRVEAALQVLDQAEARVGPSEAVWTRLVGEQRAATLIHAGRHDEAEPLLQDHLAWARSRNAPLMEVGRLAFVATSAADRGDLDRAATTAREAASVAERCGYVGEGDRVAGLLAIVAVLGGRAEDALAHAGGREPARLGLDAVVALVAAGRRLGRPAAAAEAELARALAAGDGRTTQLRPLVRAFEEGRADTLSRAAEPAVTWRVEDRLAARCLAWLLAVPGAGSSETRSDT